MMSCNVSSGYVENTDGTDLTRESALAAGQDNRVDVVSRVKLGDSRVKLVEERRAERVQCLGAVEGNERDTRFGLGGEDVLEVLGRHEAECSSGRCTTKECGSSRRAREGAWREAEECSGHLDILIKTF
jgi:hypothetical protein